MLKRKLPPSAQGLKRTFQQLEDGRFGIHYEQDVEPILERNKASQNHNDGYTPSRDMARIATIPAVVGLKWLVEEGWWYQDPECADKLRQKLNDPEWHHLRTSNLRV